MLASRDQTRGIALAVPDLASDPKNDDRFLRPVHGEAAQGETDGVSDSQAARRRSTRAILFLRSKVRIRRTSRGAGLAAESFELGRHGTLDGTSTTGTGQARSLDLHGIHDKHVSDEPSAVFGSG